MPKVSAGLLMYRVRGGQLQVLLAHPGGPFWRKRDQGAWTIPKGEIQEGEDALTAARREFHEETGLQAHGPFADLGTVRQKSGKIVHAWAFEGDCDPHQITSNTFQVQWPPRSGKWITCPEIDRAAFFTLDIAREKILESQIAFLDRLRKVTSAKEDSIHD